MQPSPRGVAVSVGVALAAAMSFVSSAAASFPGANGSFAVEVDGCDWRPIIRLYGATGDDLGAVTAPGCSIAHSTPLFDWSPDGRRLLVGRSGAPPDRILTVAPDGGEGRILPLPTGASDPSFAPDGLHVAFMLEGSIWTAATDGTELRELRRVPPCVVMVRDCAGFQRPRWSPNGRLIAFESHKRASGQGGPPEIGEGIWLISARTGRLVRRVARRGHELDWSPGSRRLVYRTDYGRGPTGAASGGDIWIVRANGEGSRRLVRRRRLAETYPTWSPDGRWVAWISLRFGNSESDFGIDVNPSLWRVRSHGGRPKRLTRLRPPTVDEGDFIAPKLAWQALP